MIKNKSKLALFVAFVMLAGVLLPGYTRTNGIGNVYYSSHLRIFDGADFSEIYAGNDTNGVERAYTVTADFASSSLQPVVFAGDVSSRYVLDTMVNTLEAQGLKVVAGVNGDIFDTSTGCTMGLTIHDGVIVSSGYDPKFAISFDETGKAELVWTSVNYGLSTEIFVPQADGSYAQTPYRANIGYFNVPHGKSKSLHLYNRSYGASTKTNGENIEVILDAGSSEAARLRLGSPITATVSAIRYSGGDAPIGDSQLVLSTEADSETAKSLAEMAVGMRVEINATDLDKGALSRSKECIGMYYLLYDHGKWVTEGTNPNPRTLLGIKNDGSVMLYVLDGRQPGISGGLGLTDAAKHMVELGCVVVANLDGGGSSAMVVRKPGIDAKATVKNSPSGGSQRAVANGLFFVYKDLPAREGSVLSTYQDHYLALPGADVKLTTYRSNGLYERSGAGAVSGLRYDITEGGGSVSQGGVYTAGDAPGKVQIAVRDGGAETTASLEVVDRDLSLTPSVKEIFADPRQTLDLNVTARHGYAPVAQRDNLFTWECDDNVGVIDENGVFTAADRVGVAGAVRVSYDGKFTVNIPVQVGAKITFTDLLDPVTGLDHWAKQYIESLANQGIVNGVGGDMFGPDLELTRAQFLAMLAKTMDGLDLNAQPPSGFEDVPTDGWYYSYVNWGYGMGVVKGVDETHFAPDLPITREQMTVMLANFAAVTGMPLIDAGVSPVFADSAVVSVWALEAVEKIVRAGIMNGMPDGAFAPQTGATRAQAAKVAYMLCEMRAASPPAVPPPGDASDTPSPVPPPGGDASDTPSPETPPEDSGEQTPPDFIPVH
jgi:hypothetical protein